MVQIDIYFEIYQSECLEFKKFISNNRKDLKFKIWIEKKFSKKLYLNSSKAYFSYTFLISVLIDPQSDHPN